MKIVNIQSFNGRNIYSHKPIVKLAIDLEKYYDIPTKDIKRFNDTLIYIFPGINKHCCSLGYKGGFIERLKEGTYLAHVAEHIILEIQTEIGYEAKYGKTRLLKKPDIYNIIYEFANEKCAIESAYLTVELVNLLIEQKYINIQKLKEIIFNKIKKIKALAVEYDLGPSTQAIVDEAIKRDIPITRLNNESFVQLGYGKHRRIIQATITDLVSCVNVDLVGNKLLTKQILKDYDIPVPDGDIVYSQEDAIRLANDIQFPVTLKPYNSNQGKGVTLNIINNQQIKEAFKIANQFSNGIMVEQFIEGKDYRVLVVGDKVSAVAQRCAAHVIGDGKKTIQELVEEENKNILRGNKHEKPLTKIKIDKIAKQILKRQDFSQDSIPPNGEKVLLRENGNISTGGTAIDCTHLIDSYNAKIAVKAAQIMGLDVAGIDIITPDISVPIYKNQGTIIEVNAAPGIRMHIYPTEGQTQDVAKDIVNMLFPSGIDSSIPIISVTGTNGKTTTARMISHILKTCNIKVGMTTTNGTYINDECILEGDNTGPTGARILLRNPDVEAVVLETARGGIVKRGLGYDKADVGVITNITEDHIGVDGIDTIEDLSYVKSLVAEAVNKEGYVVLNADDNMVLEIRKRVKNKVIYFSKNHNNPIIIKHIKEYGRAVYIKDNIINIKHNDIISPVINVDDIPATYHGKVECNIENSLAAVSTAFALGIPVENIFESLKTFSSDENINPGRFNLLNVGNFKVLVDYGHNIAGYKTVINSAQKLEAKRMVGVIGMPSDRMKKHIKTIGKICGKNFDNIYIKEDKNLRGHKQGETSKILYDEVLKTGKSEENVEIIFDEVTALTKAMMEAEEGDLIIIFYEDFEPVAACIRELSEKLKKTQKTASAFRKSAM